MSLGVPLETLGIYTDGGAHPTSTAAHTEHETGSIAKDDPETLQTDIIELLFQMQFFKECHDYCTCLGIL